MMKSVVLAVAMFGFAGAAFAGADRPVSFSTYGEYAVEADAFEFGAGADLAVPAVPELSLGVAAVATDTPVEDIVLDHLEVNASYVITTGAEVYGKMTFNGEAQYDESVVGVALSF